MLEFHHLNLRVGGVPLLDDLDFTLQAHSFTALIGKNGCGKSTLVSCINQTRPYSGQILCNGRDLATLRPRERAALLSILPQHLTAPHITVEALVALGRSPYLDLGRRLSPRDREAVARAMDAVGVGPLAGRFVDSLSGGERQNAYLAMVLAQDSPLLVLDEPTTYMDADHESGFLRSLAALGAQEGKTLLVILHSLNQAVRWADRIAVMEAGRIRFEGPTAQCLEEGVIEGAFHVRRYEADGHIFFEA
ncbi:MAG: ABC transporter ATP-binding protein [Oscillospiraceae bacterium]|nr:ABC transporter ATP-binding protein [Oscillospiraceae bacterium]